jgi:hypothetical protein
MEGIMVGLDVGQATMTAEELCVRLSIGLSSATPEYVSRVLSRGLASEYRCIMPMLGRAPCELSSFRQRWFTSTALTGIPIPWFCA